MHYSTPIIIPKSSKTVHKHRWFALGKFCEQISGFRADVVTIEKPQLLHGCIKICCKVRVMEKKAQDDVQMLAEMKAHSVPEL